MKRIATTNAPAALGPYAQAVDTGDTVYCSGQLGLEALVLPAGVRICERVAPAHRAPHLGRNALGIYAGV